MMTGRSLEQYYNNIHMIVVVKKMFSLTEIENMIPFELDLYRMFDKVYHDSLADQQRVADSLAKAQAQI